MGRRDPGTPVERAVAAVSPERIAARIEELAAIGAEPGGGVTRLALTPEEQEARELVRRWLEGIGFECRQDDAGNVFGARGPAPRILVGSHLDTVPQGGRFDGALGVVAAAEVAAAVRAADIDLPMEVVAWTGEEGSRFGIGLFGSASAFGHLPADAWDRADVSGTTAREAAAVLLGRDPDPAGVRLDPRSFRAYLELHIEQGSELGDRGAPVGVVDRIVGISHGRVRLGGRADHAGTTRMHERRDALAGGAECVLAVERIARESGGDVVATVGELSVEPGAQNVVPGWCELSLDLRSADDGARAAAAAQIRSSVETVASNRGLAFELEWIGDLPAVAMSREAVAALEAGCEELGLGAPQVVSRAGHDAQSAAEAAVPTGMLFVRSSGGSHNPHEHAGTDDAAAGTRALLLACAELSGGRVAGARWVDTGTIGGGEAAGSR